MKDDIKIEHNSQSQFCIHPYACISTYFGKPKLSLSGHISVYRNMTHKSCGFGRQGKRRFSWVQILLFQLEKQESAKGGCLNVAVC